MSSFRYIKSKLDVCLLIAEALSTGLTKGGLKNELLGLSSRNFTSAEILRAVLERECSASQSGLAFLRQQIFFKLAGFVREAQHEDSNGLTDLNWTPDCMSLQGDSFPFNMLCNGKVNSPLLDLKCRFAIAHARLGQFRIFIFGNKSLRLKKKALLFDTLILSAVFCNLAAWAPFTKMISAAWTRKLGGLYRRFAVMHAGIVVREWNDLQLRHEMGLLAPSVLLRSLRLMRFLARVICTSTEATWALLQLGSPWWYQLQSDVAWLQQQRGLPLEMGSLLDNWDQWSHYISLSPSRWKKLVQKQHNMMWSKQC